MPSIDLNCDLGESFGAYTIGMDAEVLPFVSSANIACGFHAGDPSVMQKSVQICRGLDAAKWQSLLRRLRRMSSIRSVR